MSTKQAAPTTVKPLTDAQYARWARLARVSVDVVRMYHKDTGVAPKPGFRRINVWSDFPGLQQLHAWVEMLGAEAEAFIAEKAASRKAAEALEQWQSAQRLHASLTAAHSETRAAYRRLAGLDARQ